MNTLSYQMAIDRARQAGLVVEVHEKKIEELQAQAIADANIIDGLQCGIGDLRNKLEEAENALGRRRDGTHWDDCWKSHLACALARIERMQQELDIANTIIAEQVLRNPMFIRNVNT